MPSYLKYLQYFITTPEYVLYYQVSTYYTLPQYNAESFRTPASGKIPPRYFLASDVYSQKANIYIYISIKWLITSNHQLAREVKIQSEEVVDKKALS